MKLSEKQWAFSRMVGPFLIWLVENGYEISLEGATRPSGKLKLPGGKKMTYQELLLYNGKSKVTWGKHNMKLAIDLTLWKNGKLCSKYEYRPAGEQWEAMGGRWGGRFGVNEADYANKIGWDANHFEYKT